MRINDSSSSISILSQLRENNKKLSKTFEQLASGKRVNSAKDDPAALALASSLESSLRGIETANQGISYSQGALNTAAGGLSSTLDSLQRARELAVQSANGTLSDSDRNNLQTEYDQVLENIDSVASQTSFGGTSLLDGSFSSDVLTGADGQTQNISVESASAASLGVSTSGIATQSAAEDAIESIDSAIASVNSQLASIGASQNALEFSSNANDVAKENLAAAQSNAVDADFGQLASQLSQQKIQQAAQLAVLKAEQETKKSFYKSLLAKA